MKIHVLQHVAFEDPGAIGEWITARRHSLLVTRLYRGDPLPDLERPDLVIVLGGPMSVHDEAQYPWLTLEKRCLAQAIHADKRVLGICLGAQLIAEVLGAGVAPNAEREIGWFPITVTPEAATSPIFGALPDGLTVFHWHGETFDLPAGATLMATSAACRHQAFTYGPRVTALQFHLESTPRQVEALLTHCADALVDAPYVQRPQQMLAGRDMHFAAIKRVLFGVLDRLSVASEA